MNDNRLSTSGPAPRGARFALFLSLFAAFALSALLLAAYAAPLARHFGASRRAEALHVAHVRLTPLDFFRHAPNGRALLDRNSLRPGIHLRANAQTGVVVPISSPVQTYDVFNSPPAFRPLVGFGSLTALNDNSANPPVYVGSLLPTNLTPVWSSDETFLVFSSNRTLQGGLNADGVGPNGTTGPRFHLWAILISGGEAFQITASTGPIGGGEFFPALLPNNTAIAYTSDANSPGVQNLYEITNFSFPALAGGMAPANVNTQTSLTIRGNDTNNLPLTGFDQVQRPTFSPTNPGEIVFSAHSVTGTNAGHFHLYFLYAQTLGFDPNTNLSYPGKLTDGPAEDTDPTISPDGGFIAFSSTATSFANQPNGMNSFGPNPPSAVQDPNQSQSISSTPGATRGIFLLGGGSSANGIGFGTVPPTLSAASAGQQALGLGGGRVSQPGTDDFGPAWSSFSNKNQYTNPTGDFGYLAFGRGTATTQPHDIFYLQVLRGVTSPNTQTIDPETPAGGANLAVKLNTDDNAGETSPAGNAFDDVYPAWSPFLSVFRLVYASNRTVTYNNPQTSVPVEVAASVPQGGTVAGPDATSGYTVGTSYSGLLLSQLVNLDPPTLLRFSANEVVHVQAAGPDPVNGTPNKLAATGGQQVTLTVRLSDREAGIDDTGGPNGGPRVYVQIKDPSSKYQNSQNTEHKVFAKDFLYDGSLQTNRPQSDVTSGSANTLVSNFSSKSFDSSHLPDFFPPGFQKRGYPSYNSPQGTIAVNYLSGGELDGSGQFIFAPLRGAHGGEYAASANNPDLEDLYIGKAAAGTTNPYTAPGGSTTTGGVTAGSTITFPIPNPYQSLQTTDPNLFIPQGPEYECQVVNPQFNSSGQTDTTLEPATDTVANPGPYVGDYVTPYWLAGIDDQNPFSGGAFGSGTDRPTADYTVTNSSGSQNATTVHPAEWLQLTRVPAAQQDNKGGVLYTVTWTTPSSGSDFYTDIIAYDKAVFPNLAANTSAFSGRRTNWRIYDNVGGFSTNQSVGNNDILVVSDYALGQKFAATTFGGQNSNGNLVPKLFGAESYLTDIDVSRLPDSSFAGQPAQQLTASPQYITYDFYPVVQQFLGSQFVGDSDISISNNAQAENGLGVGSFVDKIIDDGVRQDQRPNVQSQRYSIWRILSRGPLPATVLNSYLPTKVTQPAIADPGDPAYRNIPAKTVLDAPRCVIWLSPYTGDVLADPGALDDPGTINVAGQAPRQSTTQNLRAFAQAGGRLFMTGQNVGSALTIGGTSANGPGGFLSDVLNATLAAPTGGTNVLAATNNRITGGSTYDSFSFTTFGGSYFTELETQGAYNYAIEFPNFPYQDNLVLSNADYNDSALSQIPAEGLPGGGSIQGQINVITPTNGATTAITYGAGGPAALVYHDDPFDATKPGTLPNGGTGSRVVYAAFGIEALSDDYYTAEAPNPSTGLTPSGFYPSLQIPIVLPRNPRPAILHNIVSFLRTGRVSGTITQTAGTGQGAGLGIQGVTVYLRPTAGPPSTRAAFSATTGSGGAFTIVGVEPGTYTLVALKPGFMRAASNSNVSFTVEGDTTATNATLTLTPANPGSIAGLVHDPKGNPINGATVTFTSQDGSVTQTATTANGSVTTNPTDNYFLQNVPITTYTGTATGPINPNGKQEYMPVGVAPDAPNTAGVAVQGNQTTDGVNFTLTPILAGIKGHLFDITAGADTPANVLPGTTHITLVNQASITAANPTGTIIQQEDNLAGSNFDFENVPASTTPTTYVITATNPNYASSSLTVTVYLGDVLTGQDIGLNPLPRVKGIVTDSTTGQGIALATVTFTPAPGSPAGAKVVVVKTSDGTNGPVGTYSAGATEGIVAATYTVTAAVGGYTPSPTSPQPATVTLQPGPPTTQNFVLTPIPPGTLTGRVVDQNGAGVPGAIVTFVSSDGSQTLTVTTAADGTYTKTGVVPTTYTGTAIGPNNPNGHPTTTVSATQTATVGAGQTVTVNFTVTETPPSLAGRVYNASGAGGDVAANALPKATVTVTNTATGQVVYTVQTPDGNYSTGPLPLAPAGTTYTVTAALTGYGANTLTVKVYNGDTLTGQDIGLLPLAPGTISGFVKDNLGNPLAGITVTFTASDGTQTVSATTAADGSYLVKPAPAATSPLSYTGTASVPTNPNGKPEYLTPASQTVMVQASAGATANFTEVQILPTVSGTVTDKSNSSPLVGATVTFTPTTGTGAPITVTTGPGGTYSVTAVQNLQPGTYTVTASQPNGYFDSTVTLTVYLGDSLTLPFALTEKATLFGLVTDAATHSALAGVLLTVTDTTGAPVATIPASVSTGAATQGPDGLPINYTASIAPGTYRVTASKGTYNSKTQTVILSQGPGSRADFALVSSIGTLGGLVTNATDTTPVGGATVTVTDSGKNTVATFTTSGAATSPAAPGGDGSPLNYSGTLGQGTYTVTLTFTGRPSVSQTVTIVGGQFTRLNFTGSNGVAPLHTFPSGLNFLSTPYDYSNFGFDGLFGALNTTATGTQSNGNRSHVAVWNPLGGQYAIDPTAPADTLRLGVGYWVFLKNPAPVTQQGATPTAGLVPVSLHAFWNQIGVPNPNGVPISSLLFDNGSGGTITFAQATNAQYHLVSPTLYSYDGQNYQPLGPGQTLAPWQAYWIKVYADATLEVPTR